jgi:hypothetical protein
LKRILILLLALYGHSAWCEALQVRADRSDPDRLKQNGKIHAWGTGFYVSKYHVMTCAHTLDKHEQVFIKIKNDWVQCRVVRLDKDEDMALLETTVEGESIEFANIPPLSVSGAPKKFPPELMKLRTTAASMDVSYVRCDEVDQGDSGAPVMADGRLIGMVLAQAKMQNDEGVYAKIAGVLKIAEFLK